MCHVLREENLVMRLMPQARVIIFVIRVAKDTTKIKLDRLNVWTVLQAVMVRTLPTQYVSCVPQEDSSVDIRRLNVILVSREIT